ncbi:MAG: hypothetical protein QM723_30900 [Myxococcaceae bacterium]
MQRAPRFSWLLLVMLSVFVLKLSACHSSIDPDKHTFHCAAADDCGKGFDCIVQADGGGSLCFKQGACLDHEECNGKDDNCDGVIDETFPGRSDPCVTGGKGICASGNNECVDGGVVCVQMVFSMGEVCNNQDDDCDGTVDNGFDKQTDDNNCGSCGHVCSTGDGLKCIGGKCREGNCSDGIDNDDAGGADCLDPACSGKLCFVDGSDAGWHCGLPRDGGVSDGGTDAGFDGGTDAGADGGSDAGDPDAGDTDGGLDGGAPDAGGPDAGGLDGGGGPLGCYPPETDCQNGADDDLNGLTDCADPACDGQTCSTGAACTMGNCPPAG